MPIYRHGKQELSDQVCLVIQHEQKGCEIK